MPLEEHIKFSAAWSNRAALTAAVDGYLGKVNPAQWSTRWWYVEADQLWRVEVQH